MRARFSHKIAIGILTILPILVLGVGCGGGSSHSKAAQTTEEEAPTEAPPSTGGEEDDGAEEEAPSEVPASTGEEAEEAAPSETPGSTSGQETGVDSDGDGYPSVSTGGTDCDDAVAGVNPGASEACDGVDNDCDSAVDEGVQTLFYADADGDSYGNEALVSEACAAPAGYVSDRSDCDDTSAQIFPGATESCNGVDDDCDGVVDNDTQAEGGSGWERSICGVVVPDLVTSGDANDPDTYDQPDVMWNSDLGKYQMWLRMEYYDSIANTVKNGIGYAESEDGFSWTRQETPILVPGGTGAWDEKVLGFPTVVYREGIYHLWYQGQDTSNRLHIGYAASADGGATWTKSDANPVLTYFCNPATDTGNDYANVTDCLKATSNFDNASVQAPSVMFDASAGTYRMWYTGIYNNGSGVSFLRTGYAESAVGDPITWTKNAEAVLDVGASAEWDEWRAIFARVYFYEGLYHLWYSGEDLTKAYTYEIGHATSPDGLVWTKDVSNPVFSFSSDPAAFDAYMVYAGAVIPIDGAYYLFYSGSPDNNGPFQIGLATAPGL